MALSANLSKSCVTDNINDTVNYEEIIEIIKFCFKNSKKNLIESIAYDIAKNILTIKGVLDVEIKIRKPSAPIKGICDSVEVSIFRKKDE